MISLAKDTTATPDFYSDGDGSDPLLVNLLLDGTGGTVTEQITTPIYLWADNLNSAAEAAVYSYTDIQVTTEQTTSGISWEFSLDELTWLASLPVDPLVVELGYQTTQVYARVNAVNDGSVPTGSHTAIKALIAAVEVPIE